ncbi:hypothetical protein DFP73DRAFT_526724 [Morchella snyderi]|nr:hypothetical protein DFP73DRAFT_526724 [Morchella snyderi]
MRRSSSVVFITLVLPIPLTHALLDTGFNITKPSWLFNGILPASATNELPTVCISAYTEPINCNITILMSPNLDNKNETLEDTCNPACAASLLNFQKNLKDACAGIDLRNLDLDTSWLEAAVDGAAGVLLYWKQCVRDLKTDVLCMITEEDYVIAWDAVSADTASDASVQRFCADNCLTQSVVLNVPSAENIEDLREMCSDIEIEEFPFIDAMVFANLIEENNGISVITKGFN